MLFQVHLRSGKTAITSWLRLTVQCGVTIQSKPMPVVHDLLKSER